MTGNTVGKPAMNHKEFSSRGGKARAAKKLLAVSSTDWLGGQREAVVKAYRELHITWLSARHRQDMNEEMDRLAERKRWTNYADSRRHSHLRPSAKMSH